MPAKLRFLDGEWLNVLQSAEDAALLLWGQKKGDDAHDKGFATLQGEGDVIHVNPAAVMYVVDASPNDSRTGPSNASGPLSR